MAGWQGPPLAPGALRLWHFWNASLIGSPSMLPLIGLAPKWGRVLNICLGTQMLPQPKGPGTAC